MNKHTMLALTLGVAVCGWGGLASADEADATQATCAKVMARATHLGSEPEQIAALCKANKGDLAYWQCMDKRTADGQSFHDAGLRCHPSANTNKSAS